MSSKPSEIAQTVLDELPKRKADGLVRAALSAMNWIDAEILCRAHLRLRGAGQDLLDSCNWNHEPRCPIENRDCSVCDFIDALEERDG